MTVDLVGRHRVDALIGRLRAGLARERAKNVPRPGVVGRDGAVKPALVIGYFFKIPVKNNKYIGGPDIYIVFSIVEIGRR